MEFSGFESGLAAGGGPGFAAGSHTPSNCLRRMREPCGRTRRSESVLALEGIVTALSSFRVSPGKKGTGVSMVTTQRNSLTNGGIFFLVGWESAAT